MAYRHIHGATQYGPPQTTHHYINESRPGQQFIIEIDWHTMTVEIREFDGESWRAVSKTPLNATSPAT